MMQEERRVIGHLSLETLRATRASLDAGPRGKMNKNVYQRQSSNSTVAQDRPTRRRTSNSTWLTARESGVVHERLQAMPKTPSVGNSSSSGKNIPEAPARYRMYQPPPWQRFNEEEARSTVKAVVEATLGGTEYSAASCAETAKTLAERVKQAAKAQLCDRYKLVSYVAIGQAHDCGVMCASRAVWSPAADTFVEFIFKNESLFALCILYAVYKE